MLHGGIHLQGRPLDRRRHYWGSSSAPVGSLLGVADRGQPERLQTTDLEKGLGRTAMAGDRCENVREPEWGGVAGSGERRAGNDTVDAWKCLHNNQYI